jgi:hypothetical protein
MVAKRGMKMLTEVFALTLALATQKADPVAEARKVYSNCLVDVTVESLDKKEDQSVFNAKTETACAPERAKFRDVVIAGEKSFGSNQSDAETTAKDEVDSLLEKYTSSYGDFMKDNTRPTKQKVK